MSVALIYVCSLFMIGRNLFSLFFKIFDLLNAGKRKKWLRPRSRLLILILLILTAILGLISGIWLLVPSQMYGYYLYLVVSGMMIYSYFSYAGTCFEEEKWFMFGVCIAVILFTAVLASFLAVYLAGGIIK